MFGCHTTVELPRFLDSSQRLYIDSDLCSTTVLFRFGDNNGYANAPRCYVTRALPVWLLVTVFNASYGRFCMVRVIYPISKIKKHSSFASCASQYGMECFFGGTKALPTCPGELSIKTEMSMEHWLKIEIQC